MKSILDRRSKTVFVNGNIIAVGYNRFLSTKSILGHRPKTDFASEIMSKYHYFHCFLSKYNYQKLTEVSK